MGYDFINAHGESFGFNQWGWPGICELALRHGWEPVGTAPSIEPEIRAGTPLAQLIANAAPEPDGSYLGNDWQVVTGPDALALAAALERTLPDLSNDDLQKLSEKKHLLKFINFCRRGGFTIG